LIGHYDRMNNPSELAARGRSLLQEAILGELSKGPASNAELAKALDLQSDHQGNDKNYLTWMVLGDLLRMGKVVKRRVSTEGSRVRTEFALA